jgi:hypothetical protein
MNGYITYWVRNWHDMGRIEKHHIEQFCRWGENVFIELLPSNDKGIRTDNKAIS